MTSDEIEELQNTLNTISQLRKKVFEDEDWYEETDKLTKALDSLPRKEKLARALMESIKENKRLQARVDTLYYKLEKCIFEKN